MEKQDTDPIGKVRYLGGVSVQSVSNTDGSLTISPTTGIVIASLNVGHFNTWTAIQYFNGGATVNGNKIDQVVGSDNRKGVTTTDTTAITLTTANGTLLYKLTARILATAGTTISVSYAVAWTENATVITKTLTVTTLNADQDLASILIQPDNATNITAQITALSGTGTTVNVASSAEVMNQA